MAVIRAGLAGPGIRADVQVTAEPSDRFAYSFSSSTSPLYDEAIKREIEEAAEQFGGPPLQIHCIDSGALPFTWRARLKTVFSLALGQPLTAESRQTARERRSGPLRTRLYIPANTPKLYPNASLSRPDALVFDLEDAVPPDKRREALDLLVEGLQALEWPGCQIMVRINAGPQGLEEAARLCHLPVDAFVVPKVESPGDLAPLLGLLESAGGHQSLMPLIESALGVENAYAIACADARVAALSLGLEDYTADLGAERTQSQEESAYARSRVLNAARAAGIIPLASVYPGFEDPEALAAYASQARRLGYEGIGCIHPSQTAVVHKAFAPSEKEVARAERIVRDYEAAQASGAAAASSEGEMVDGPTYARALRTLGRREESQ